MGRQAEGITAADHNDLLVLPINDPHIHQRWAELYSYARDNGKAIQHDHNDVWIAATAHVAGLKLLSTDSAAFLPLRGTALG
jgi:predicted nucleic acid-binding protein